MRELARINLRVRLRSTSLSRDANLIFTQDMKSKRPKFGREEEMEVVGDLESVVSARGSRVVAFHHVSSLARTVNQFLLILHMLMGSCLRVKNVSRGIIENRKIWINSIFRKISFKRRLKYNHVILRIRIVGRILSRLICLNCSN